ncbi:MAG: FAD-dependent monooxygenase [Rhodospirillaceae bacterium]|jgi:salicylate hydroxylase|nr:FAD-dependent monooxygenase [Rhodospirillaceae bacterium]
MEDVRIAIIGAGMAGLTSALSLQKNGFKPIVYELAPELGEVGAGLTISPNSTLGLEYVGLADGLSKRANIPLSQAIMHYQTGEILVETERGDLPKQKYGAHYYQIHRADLHEMLSDAAQANDPDCMVLDHAFTNYRKTDDGIEITFANGNTVPCDVVIGADGIRSAVRESMFGPEDPKFTGNVAYRGLVNKGDLSNDVVTPASGVAIAPRKAFTRYLVRDGEVINFVAFVRRDGWNEEGWSIPATTEELLEEFGDWHPRIRALIEAAPKDKVFKWALYDRDPLEQWTKDRVTLLGDAAHPMLPFMGMGAAMGIEDGVVLGRAFAAADSIDNALERYEAARKERANFVLLRSRVARDRLQSDNPEQYDDSKHKNEESLGLFDYNPGTVPV